MAETTAWPTLTSASLVHGKMSSHVRKTALQITAGMCCLAATVVSYNLLLKHVAGSSGQTWFEAGCSEETGPGRANCDAVLATPYSYFPPKRPHESSERRHIPVAFLGMLYYSALLVWTIGVGPPSRERRWLHLVPLVMVEFGIPASLYYTFIMFRVLDEWCPWCLVTHILNVLIAVCIALMWPRTGVPAEVGARRESEDQLSHRSPRPSVRALLLTVSVSAVVAYANLNTFELKTWQQKADGFHSDYESCRSVVRRIKRDTNKLVAMWQGAKPCEISMRPDDPVRLRAASSDDQPPLAGHDTYCAVSGSDHAALGPRRFDADLRPPQGKGHSIEMAFATSVRLGLLLIIVSAIRQVVQDETDLCRVSQPRLRHDQPPAVAVYIDYGLLLPRAHRTSRPSLVVTERVS